MKKDRKFKSLINSNSMEKFQDARFLKAHRLSFFFFKEKNGWFFFCVCVWVDGWVCWCGVGGGCWGCGVVLGLGVQLVINIAHGLALIIPTINITILESDLQIVYNYLRC